MFNLKRMTAATPDTNKRLLLGAGVYAKNFVVGTDTMESVKAAGRLLATTSGGGTLTITKNGHYTQIDGLPENTRGTYILDNWTASSQATVKEYTKDALKLALAAAQEADDAPEGYTGILPKAGLEDSDYLDNITFIGRLSGSKKPILIQLFNVFNTQDFSMAPKDGDEATFQLTLTAHYNVEDTDTPPFAIYYPTEVSE